MVFGSLAVVAFVVGFFSFQDVASPPVSSPVPLVRLKPAGEEMRRLVTEGYARSATFRSLVDRLDRSQALVVVQFGLCANGRFRSCVTNVESDGRMRHIRIKVNTRATEDRLIATIAHELQHALEILADPAVVDAETAMTLYRRIGTGACRQGLSDACETDEAQAIEARVVGELFGAGRR